MSKRKRVKTKPYIKAVQKFLKEQKKLMDKLYKMFPDEILTTNEK